MFNRQGTPPRASATGSLRERSRNRLYNHKEVASRSMTDLPSSMAYEHSDMGVLLLPTASAFPRPRPYSLASTSWTATRSMQDLSTIALEPAQRNGFDPPRLRSSHAIITTERMQRFLLHNLMFTYDIDPDHFRYYLHIAGSNLLSSTEIHSLLSLGRDLQIVYRRVQNNRFSLLLAEDCMRIVEDIFVPAQNLNIEPGYLCELLMNLPDHDFDREKRRSARIYNQVTRKSFWRGLPKWDTKKARKHLAQCLVSDDYAVERIAPSTQVQVLVGTNIEFFSDEHCKEGFGTGSVDRKIYVSEHIQRMLDAVILRARVPERSAQESQRRRSRSDPLQQRPAHLGRQGSSGAKGSRLTGLNEINEPEQRALHEDAQ